MSAYRSDMTGMRPVKRMRTEEQVEGGARQGSRGEGSRVEGRLGSRGEGRRGSERRADSVEFLLQDWDQKMDTSN